eukprot:CAMPEP_0197308502 /NCGR_PEP_ID=MMETSP0891-20130614/6865_1 /TAXON_ID=44058 ORGANISM="Aureoumbra lagunensis, Strain CCMP1510" /NCGR_SAMPLE_ID=MMETSP0891 /ASSEMBLY_ACC=CAM_ASM_000534 /LENGTH=1990 /DNA_ID=CAMNT_0042792899 /DNA_START=20 /DNA_END=5992 /DNA_ORIENTATION=+
MDVEDRLEVKVVAARDLSEVEGGECNPFVIVKCGNEFEQTQVLNHTTNPEWNSARMVFQDVTENGIDHIVVRINHKNLSAQADETIGQAIVDLRTVLLSPGIESDEWYDLQGATGMKMSATGAVRIEMTYFLSEGDEALPDDDDDDDLDTDADQRLPNMLVGSIVRARGLYVQGKELPDSYASIRVSSGSGLHKSKTKVAKKNSSPHWDHQFRLPVSDGEENIILKVKDHGALRTNLVGQCIVPMVEVAAHGDQGLKKWCKLLGQNFTVDGTEHGDVELQLSWIYDRKYARSLRGMMAAATGIRRTKQKARAEDDDSKNKTHSSEELALLTGVESEELAEYAPAQLSTKEQEELDEQRENRKMMAERVEDDLIRGNSNMVAGDYQIQVHVIEARDLNAEDLNGLSDPYVRVKILGRSKKTRVIRKVTSCVFDETLYFNLSALSKKQIEEAVVEIQCYDYDTFTAHDLIGIATFDCKAVHALPDHELYHHWTGLIDTKSKNDNGYQGFLKLSITVLGPGDAQKFHDLDKEYLEEQALEEKEDALGGLSLGSGPSIDEHLNFLVVYIWEAEDLPKMDPSFFFKDAGSIEAYVKVEFAGNSIHTSTVNISGRGNMAPVFNEELWLPVIEPTKAKRITLGMWDYNTFSPHAPVAHLYFDYDELKRNEAANRSSTTGKNSFFGLGSAAKYDGQRPRWYNLYGAPLGVQGKRGGIQNRYGGIEASTYRGRVLVSMEIITKPSSKEQQVAHRVPFRFKPTEGLKPMAVKYYLRCFAIMGSEIPTFRTAGAISSIKMALLVSIGNYQIKYSFEQNRRGVVIWNDYQTLKNIELPVTIEDVPDVCIYLIKGPPRSQSICYCRVPAASLLKEQFLAEPKWYQLRADPGRGTKRQGGIALTVNPGAVLLKLGLGLAEDAIDPQFAWNETQLKKKVVDLAPYCLRVYVFQARHLPASDDNGLLDPYVKVRFCGKKDKTKIHSMTTAPLFYETLQFHEMLPKDKNYGPDIVLQVWDNDRFGSNTPMAMLRFPLIECVELASEASRFPQPVWRRLTDVNGEHVAGELLISAALIKKREASEKFNKPEAITPQMRQAWVEVTALGVRQLKTYRLRTPREPYVRIDVPAPNDGGTYVKTKSSKKPSGRNANFIQRRIISVEMPENALYAQQMDLRVYDARSISTPLLGACTVDLAKKMSWNADEYEPPQTELFDDTEARRREDERLEQERQAAALKAGKPADDDDDDFDDDDGGNDKDVHKPQRVGVSFGDDDEEERDEEDALLGGIEEGAEVRMQYELERYEKPPLGGTAEDSGIGAFHPMIVTELPMVYEDYLYQQEQERAAEELLLKEEEEREGRRGILSSLSARFKHATDLGLGTEEEGFKLSDLDISFPTQWAAADFLEGREWWTEEHDGHELENYLKTKPFETYQVYRGRYHPDPSKSTLRSVGVFKGIVRVLDQDPLIVGELIPEKLLRERTYMVRLYVIRGANLQPVDSNSADPYLRVKLGKDVDERKREHLDRTLKPNFYQTFEFQTTLPGPSVLKIQVKDWNRFYPIHELIGETKIDLEDRWFHPEWQKLDATRQGEINKLKPIEVRSLRKETSSVTQGQLYMWLEIRPDWEARRDPKVELEGPEKKKFEVRVICWKSIEVPREMGDYYCQFWIGDSRKQKTDIHWRCRYGKASWNWRIKIPVTLPLDSPEKGRLAIQLWDQDILKWNDVIGENEIDLYKFFLKAYHEKRTVNVFKLINDAREKKLAEEQGLITEEDLEEEDDDSGSDDDDEDNDENEDNDADEDEDDGGDRKEDPNQDLETGEEPLLGEEDTEAADDGDEENKDKTKKKKKKKKDTTNSDDDEFDEGPPPDPKEAEKQDAEYFVKQLKELVGLGEIDSTAQWIKLTYHDRRRGKVYNRGRVAISIEILPEEEAEIRPAGHGRSEPNSNPYLPPTTGRMALSSFYNPFALCVALLGDRMAYQILCVCCCIIILVALGFLGMYWTSFYTLLLSLGIA